MDKQHVIDEILSRLRLATTARDPCSLGIIISGALDGAELRSVSDKHLLLLLRARAFFTQKSPPSREVTLEHLAAMDDAKQQASASSYNWLRSQMQILREKVRIEGEMTIAGETNSPFGAAEFEMWLRKRYPHAWD